MDNCIEVNSLNHHYIEYKLTGGILTHIFNMLKDKEKTQSLYDVSFSVPKGQCYGLLGANGAGKTTIIKLLCGLLHPTSGSISVLGYNPAKRSKQLLRQIGVLFGNRGQLIWDLPPADTWNLIGAAYGVSRSEIKKYTVELAERLSVIDKIEVPSRKLSLGQRMKCELICTMLHRPNLLFLDEPTLGLDVLSQNSIRNILREEKERGTTIILTSHYMKDIESVCDNLILLKNGSLEYDGDISGLIKQYKPGYVFEASTSFYIQGIGNAKEISQSKWRLETTIDNVNEFHFENLKNLPQDFSFRRYELEEAILGFQEDEELEDE